MIGFEYDKVKEIWTYSDKHGRTIESDSEELVLFLGEILDALGPKGIRSVKKEYKKHQEFMKKLRAEEEKAFAETADW